MASTQLHASEFYVLKNSVNHDFTSNDYYVYIYVDVVTGLPFYVGKGRDQRFCRHIRIRNSKSAEKANPHFIRKIRKILLDGKISIEIVFTSPSEVECFNHEQNLISQYGRACAGGGQLLNLTSGGEGNTSEGKAVSMFTMTGEHVRDYKNAKEAARLNNFPNYSAICMCCKKRERSYKGFMWAYKGSKPEYHPKTRTPTVKIVYQWTLDGILVRKYANASDAGRCLGVDSTIISDCIRGKTNTAHGFLWSTNETKPNYRESKKRRQVIHLNTGIVYKSVTDASNATGNTIQSICACCKNTKPSVGGNRYSYYPVDTLQ